MKIELDRNELRYSGRIDMTDAEKPEFIFPASSLHFRFYGARAVLEVENRGGEGWRYFAGAIVDGVQKCFELPPDDRVELMLKTDRGACPNTGSGGNGRGTGKLY